MSSCGYLPAPIPANEAERLGATRGLGLLDSNAEERFDNVVALAAEVFQAPIAYVALVDQERQWFKSKTGLHVDETPRETSFCGHAILEDNALVIADTFEDARFAGNPMVTGYPYLRFYAGQPLTAAGQKVGTLCVADHSPRGFADRDRAVLRNLGRLVEREFSLSAKVREQQEAMRQTERLLEAQAGLARLCSQLESEKRRADELLLNILPKPVADELKAKGSVRATKYDEACILFADFSGFTCVTESWCPTQVVRELNICYSAFDQICHRNRVEKMKTMGDGYLALSGILDHGPRSAWNLLRAAIGIRDFVASRRATQCTAGARYWDIRIGLHAGPLVTGVVGLRKLAFDAWGDAVNTCARLQGASEPGRINASAAFVSLLDGAALVESRGSFVLKGKQQPMEMFFLDDATIAS